MRAILMLTVFCLMSTAALMAGPVPGSARENRDAAKQQRLARINKLIEQLDVDEFMQREAAEAALLRIGEPATDALIQAAAKGSAEVKWRAIRCLVSIRKQRIFDGFVRLSHAEIGRAHV